jgi:hypothetical protein
VAHTPKIAGGRGEAVRHPRVIAHAHTVPPLHPFRPSRDNAEGVCVCVCVCVCG